MWFYEWLPTMIWYTVEFVCMLSIVAYVLFTFNIIGPIKFKNDVPATFNETWKSANSFLNTAATMANKLKKAIDNDNDDDNNDNHKKEGEE